MNDRGAAMITPEQVGERYIAVHHRMFRAVNDEMSGCGLSMARTKVLLRLREQGPTRQSVLAADFGLSPHSITDVVDALERQGLAERLAGRHRPPGQARRHHRGGRGLPGRGVHCPRAAAGADLWRPEPGGPGNPAPPARRPRRRGPAADHLAGCARHTCGSGMIAGLCTTRATQTSHTSHPGV